jgi:aryl carrier-like protein
MRDLAVRLARLTVAQRAWLLQRLEQRRAVAATADERLVAYVVPNGGEPTVADLRAALRDRLPHHLVPSAFVFLPRLPRSSSGKVDRRALPEPPPEVDGMTPVAPRTELERTITGIWRDVLGLEEVGVDQNFFDLGGHSLRLVEVHSRLRKVLGRDVSIVDLFRFPTVAALARQLVAGSATESSLSRVQERARRQREFLDSGRRRREHTDG